MRHFRKKKGVGGRGSPGPPLGTSCSEKLVVKDCKRAVKGLGEFMIKCRLYRLVTGPSTLVIFSIQFCLQTY